MYYTYHIYISYIYYKVKLKNGLTPNLKGNTFFF